MANGENPERAPEQAPPGFGGTGPEINVTSTIEVESLSNRIKQSMLGAQQTEQHEMMQLSPELTERMRGQYAKLMQESNDPITPSKMIEALNKQDPSHPLNKNEVQHLTNYMRASQTESIDLLMQAQLTEWKKDGKEHHVSSAEMFTALQKREKNDGSSLTVGDEQQIEQLMGRMNVTIKPEPPSN